MRTGVFHRNKHGDLPMLTECDCEYISVFQMEQRRALNVKVSGVHHEEIRPCWLLVGDVNGYHHPAHHSSYCSCPRRRLLWPRTLVLSAERPSQFAIVRPLHSGAVTGTSAPYRTSSFRPCRPWNEVLQCSEYFPGAHLPRAFRPAPRDMAAGLFRPPLGDNFGRAGLVNPGAETSSEERCARRCFQADC